MPKQDVYTTYTSADIEEGFRRLGPHRRRSHSVLCRELAVNNLPEHIACEYLLDLSNGWVGAGLGSNINLDVVGIGQSDELLSLLNSRHEGELDADVLLADDSMLNELVVAFDIDNHGD